MSKGFFKYLIIITANLIILTALLLLWTDKLELTFNNSIRLTEFFKILGVTAISIISIIIFLYYLNKKIFNTISIKIKAVIILTFLVSSYLYISYSIKVLKNTIINKNFRNEIAYKIKPKKFTNGTSAEKLTFREYQEIARINRYPKLPIKATNISYSHEYDGFLPDYRFTLTYEVPKNIIVNSIDFKKGDFSKYQTFKLIGNKKRVIYDEVEQ
jgi:hypothetical protein